jgi:hypothetical protein
LVRRVTGREGARRKSSAADILPLCSGATRLLEFDLGIECWVAAYRKQSPLKTGTGHYYPFG